jgi:hypothetical protein
VDHILGIHPHVMWLGCCAVLQHLSIRLFVIAAESTSSFEHLGADLNAGILGVLRPLNFSFTSPETSQDLLGIQTFLRYRGTSKALAAAAGLLVNQLRCDTACDITSGAWNSFPNAGGLILLTKDAKEHERERAASFGPMLARAPANRIKSFVLVGSTSLWAGTVAHSLVAEPNVRSLEAVFLGDGPLTAAEADDLLRGLPELQTLRARVMRSAAGPWAPAIASAGKLTNLNLAGPRIDAGMRRPVLDASGLAGSQLQGLHLEDVVLSNWTGIAGAKALELLSLRCCSLQQQPGASLQQALLQPLAQLQALKMLDLPNIGIKSADWKLLARLEALHRLVVNYVVADCTPGGPSSKVRHLRCSALALTEPAPNTSNRGMLAQLLPELQSIQCGYSSSRRCCRCPELAEALAEHPELRCFTFNDVNETHMAEHAPQARYQWQGSRPDSPAPFQTMPQLEVIDISNCSCTSHRHLLADVSRCTKLQRVLLLWAKGVLSSQPLLPLLADGAASRSVSFLAIDVADTGVDVAAVGSMLSRRAFPALHTFTVQGAAEVYEAVQLEDETHLGNWLLGQLMAELLERSPAVQVSKQPPKAVHAAVPHDGERRAAVRLVVDGIAFSMLVALPVAEDEDTDEEEDDE